MPTFNKPHALVYQGSFEVNFRRQRPGRLGYDRRDKTRVSGYRIPKGTTGVIFGLMEKLGKRFVIVRVQSPGRDVCVRKPIRSQGTGPNGTRLTTRGARKYLRALIRANPTMARQLKALAALIGA